MKKAKRKTRPRRVKGISANRRLERNLVRALIAPLLKIQTALVDVVEREWPSPVAPHSGATADAATNPIDAAFKNALVRFRSLHTLEAEVKRTFGRVDKEQRTKFRALLQRHIGVSFDDSGASPEVKKLVESRVDDTVGLIKMVGEEHFQNFRRLIKNYIVDGATVESFRAAVKKAGGKGFPTWMIERIAVDQFLTLHAEVTKQRYQAAGITHYFWRTVGDARTRPEHRKLEGKRFSWDDPPSEGNPGDAVRCRCVADPDLSTVQSVVKIKSTAWGEISEERWAGKKAA